MTNPRKRNIATAKTTLAQQAIDRHLRRLCHNCVRRAAADGRELVQVPRHACSECNGSSNGRAVSEMVGACRRAGLDRLVFVGGSPATRAELKELVGDSLKLRLVDGTTGSDKRTAQKDIRWADLIVVLGKTQLAHKVSLLYTNNPNARGKLVTTSRRGIEAIADDVTRFIRGLSNDMSRRRQSPSRR